VRRKTRKYLIARHIIFSLKKHFLNLTFCIGAQMDGSKIMRRDIFETMSTDELWQLHESVATMLASKIQAERTLLEARLEKLAATTFKATDERRPYRKAAPKYRNPQDRQETWAGRGKQPRWLAAQLRSGKKLDEFLISQKIG
jgi:DNA-binding protein H-NS